jgi:hypothetical protein
MAPGYDLPGNRTYRQNVLYGGLSEAYTYDGLGRLVGMKRGHLTFGSDAMVRRCLRKHVSSTVVQSRKCFREPRGSMAPGFLHFKIALPEEGQL